MTVTTLPVAQRAPQSAIERLVAERARQREAAARCVLETLAFATEAAERLRELASLEDDLTPCVAHDAPLLADAMDRALERMVASVRNGGRVR